MDVMTSLPGTGPAPLTAFGPAETTDPHALPDWLPNQVGFYLSHVEAGMTLRALARESGLNASTILRQVRRYENRRDDPLMDSALGALGEGEPALPPRAELEREAPRLLQRLAEPGAMLAFAPEMAKAMILREMETGEVVRTAVLDRAMAQAFCLKDWLSCRVQGKVARYELSSAGRSAWRRLRASGLAARAGGGLDEAPVCFITTPEARLIRAPLPIRSAPHAETPIAVLARRRERDGSLFLGADLVNAAERLREDHELAALEGALPESCEAWAAEDLRTADEAIHSGAARARARVAAAMRDLGPGLGDMALRVCCRLEGIETAERHMGWAARSGKIVLRIALVRLRRHQLATWGTSGPLIG